MRLKLLSLRVVKLFTLGVLPCSPLITIDFENPVTRIKNVLLLIIISSEANSYIETVFLGKRKALVEVKIIDRRQYVHIFAFN